MSMSLSDKENCTPLSEAPGYGAADVFALPATPSQHRYWSLQQLNPGSTALNMPLAWRCRGELVPDMVRTAFSELVCRHESLRTTFDLIDGKLSQIVRPPYPVQVSFEDLSPLEHQARQKRAEELILQEARIRMDMKNGPLFFARLLRMSAVEHILIVTLHHSICDGWSNGIVLRDFAAIYDGQARAIQPDLPALEVQFGDFAVWLDEWRKSSAPAESLDYWRRTLGKEFGSFRVPYDVPAKGASSEGEIETLLLTPELVQKAREFCVGEGVTLYMLLLTVYNLMLFHISGQKDLLVGSPCANRKPETENLIGPLSNPQMIRTRIELSDTFRSVLDRTRNWTLGAIIHQDLPFEDLVEDSFFSGSGNHIHPRVYFVYQRAFMQAQHTPSLDIEPIRSVSPGAAFELMMGIVERVEGPRLQLEYNPQHLQSSRIQGFLRTFARILDVCVADPNKLVVELDVLDLEEKRRLREWKLASPEGDDQRLSKSRTIAYLAPRDDFERKLANIWEGVLGLEKIGVTANFFELGGTSLMILRLIQRVNTAFDSILPIPIIYTAPTIEKMAYVLRTRVEKDFVLALQPHGSQPPLFMIQSYHLYRRLPAALGADQPFYGVRELELEDRTPPYSLDSLVRSYIDHMREVQPHGPYHLGGFCFFALLAFAVAAELERQGEEVAFLGLIDANCPYYWRPQIAVGGGWKRFRTVFSYNLDELKKLSIPDKFAYATSFTAKKVWNRMVSLSLAVRLRVYSHFVARGKRMPRFLQNKAMVTRVSVRNHTPQQIHADIYLFPAVDQPYPVGFDKSLGWNQMTSGTVKTVWLPGNHEDMFQDTNLDVMAQKIQETMYEVKQNKSALNTIR